VLFTLKVQIFISMSIERGGNSLENTYGEKIVALKVLGLSANLFKKILSILDVEVSNHEQS
jgi:hypothetical protein